MVWFNQAFYIACAYAYGQCLLVQVDTGEVPGRTFSVDYSKHTLVKDGLPFRYISGSIHYSRVRPEDWKDRLTKMYAAGLNAIQTYVPWNFHEREKGVYTFTGDADLPLFIKTAQEVGLLVILRPGPYICGEWEYGGLPWYLIQQNASCAIRSMDKDYVVAVERWMNVLLAKIQPLMYFNGGPVIMAQVENEYGSYFECDRVYLDFLVDILLASLGRQTVLFTTDGNGLGYLKCGAINTTLTTVDFGVGNSTSSFEPLLEWQPNGPLTNSEYYVGWLDLWGGAHAHVDANAAAATLKQMLQAGANVNMYMFFGGTNFGYTNGAEGGGSPQPTSYDYDAPISEAGDLTEKYFILRDAIGKFVPLPEVPMPKNSTKYSYGNISMTFVSTLSACLSTLSGGHAPVKSRYPLTMEQLGQGNGFLLYRHYFSSRGKYTLQAPGIRDRGYVTLNEQMEYLGVLDRHKASGVNMSVYGGDILDILVENQGRINYGPDMVHNQKGIISNVTVNGMGDVLENWEMHYINLTNMEACAAAGNGTVRKSPSVYKAEFQISHVGDTFLKLDGWTKGQAFINGFNLGRYWPTEGPQVTLYVPWSVLVKGVNVLTLLELESSPCELPGNRCTVEFIDKPILGKPQDRTGAARAGRRG